MVPYKLEAAVLFGLAMMRGTPLALLRPCGEIGRSLFYN